MGNVAAFTPPAAIEWPLKKRLSGKGIVFFKDRVFSAIEMSFADEDTWRLLSVGEFSQRETSAGAILVLTDPRKGEPDIEALANLAEIVLADNNVHLSIPSILDADRETVLVIGGKRRPLREFEPVLERTRF